MKKILKKEVIIAFIVGIILASSIAVYAYSYAAKDVSYTKPGTNTAISVETALNDLYENKNATLLWTNSSPNSNFNAQTLPLDLSNYKYVVIIAKASTTEDYLYRTSTIVPVGNSEYNQILSITGGSMIRNVKALSTGIEFSNSSYDNSSSYVIPLKIYGLKSDLGMWNDIIGE